MPLRHSRTRSGPLAKRSWYVSFCFFRFFAFLSPEWEPAQPGNLSAAKRPSSLNNTGSGEGALVCLSMPGLTLADNLIGLPTVASSRGAMYKKHAPSSSFTFGFSFSSSSFSLSSPFSPFFLPCLLSVCLPPLANGDEGRNGGDKVLPRVGSLSYLRGSPSPVFELTLSSLLSLSRVFCSCFCM